ncbi:hypothetical protein BD769DRAFT_1722792 [Suillus cothurnatus]|nr:hypothetical protein BD769DRAFT_1722792 [Suillus cothurnatus]
MSYPVNTLKQQDANSPGASPIPQNLPPSSPVPSASATPVATTSGACTAPSSNANPSSSGMSVSSNIISPSTTSTRKATPIPASDVNRYKRGRAIPQTKDRVLIEPGNKVFEEYVLLLRLDYRELTTPSKPPSSRWKPLAHPEGALYYYDSTCRIYTDADLSKPSTISAIEAFADKLYNDARTDPNIDITSKTELVVEDIDENTCGYYFVEQDTRCIFWLERFDAESLFDNIRRVRNMGHISNTLLKLSTAVCATLMPTQTISRTHCELFPYENRVTPAVLEELKQMIMHAAAVTITSVTSVAPFDRDELEKMLSLVTEIEGSSGKGFNPVFQPPNFTISKYYHPNAQIHLEQQERPPALAPSRKRRTRANTLHTPTPAHSSENSPKPFTPARARNPQSTSEEPSESSLSDETIGLVSRFDSPFPVFPEATAYPLRPAVFELQTPTAPQTINKATSTETNKIAVVFPPPIPKPEFLTHRLLQPTLLNPVAASIPSHPQPHLPPVQTTASIPLNPNSTVTVPAMSATNKGMTAMPGPGSNKAPSFNGETSELLDFFDIFEDLANSCALTDEQKCKIIVRYTDLLTKCFWVTITGYESKDYALFKKNILAKYPRANRGLRYTI